ncbi:MAG: glycosyltransferase family 9 protein, partial [Limisphaerales bacterium]
GDTGPLHFAAGLGVHTISLFGPSSPAQWAPIGKRHQTLMGGSCVCDGNLSVCQSANHCLAAISPEQVFACLQAVVPEFKQS